MKSKKNFSNKILLSKLLIQSQPLPTIQHYLLNLQSLLNQKQQSISTAYNINNNQLYPNHCIIIQQIMKNETFDQQIFKLITQFYKKIIIHHSNNRKLTHSLTQLTTHLQNNQHQTNLNSYQNIFTTSLRLDNDTDWKSIRTTRTISPSHSRSRSPTNSNISKNTYQNKQFGCKWIYASSSPYKVLLFSIIQAYIISDSKKSFKQLQDKVNDYLSDNAIFTPIDMLSITRIWQALGQMFNKIKKVRWQSTLKQMIDKLPNQFAQIAINQLLNITQTIETITKKVTHRLSLIMDATVKNFVIHYRQIQKNQSCGNSGKEIVIGQIRNRKIFVAANKAPQYNGEEKIDRQVKAKMAANLNNLIESYCKDSAQLQSIAQGMKEADDQKQRTVQDFCKSIMAKLQA